MNKLIALLAGTLFGLGLCVSGMLDPAKVMGFLDVTGHWDPTLLFVMGGAVLVAMPAFWLSRRHLRPLLAPAFDLPTNTIIDGRLLVGSAIFGLGWGAAGLCPGPAVSALASLQWPVLGFVVALAVGQWLADVSHARGHVAPKAAAAAHAFR